MPRRVRVRANRPPSEIDTAVCEFLITGERRPAAEALKARRQGCLILWMHDRLADVWREHKAAILAEAAKRGERHPYGEMYDRYRKDGTFKQLAADEVAEYVPAPDDPRRNLHKES